MIAPLAKFVDWSALQILHTIRLGFVSKRNLDATKWKLKDALEFLNGPDFIPAASDPAQIEFNGPRHFKFPTPRPGKVEENNIVYGQLHRCAERWQERPVVILLHGSPAVDYHSLFPLIARRFNRAGFNMAKLVAPYHLQRRPRRPSEWNYLEFARSFAQSIAEIRALTGWLLGEGCPSVGLLGVSFGGWLAGLTACSDARIASAILAIPAVRVRCSSQVAWRRVQEVFQAQRSGREAMNTTRLNLILSTPVIPKENILLIEGIHDLFVEVQPIEELWQKWQQPEIWRLPHGHISSAGVLGLTGRVLRWLAPRLEESRRHL